MREQLFYNKGHQEVVASIHFVKIETKLIKFVTKKDDEQFKSNLKHFYLL